MMGEVPIELVKNVRALCGNDAGPWLDSLPDLLCRLEREWSVRIGSPFAEGEFNFVARATDHAGKPVVIKIAPPRNDREHYSEVKYLRIRDGNSAVSLLEYDRGNMAMLLECAIPGRSLADGFLGRESAIVTSAITVLSTIQMLLPADETDIIRLDTWFSNLERAAGTAFPAEYCERALSYYHDLCSRTPVVYLHGDFHPGNIVTATREPFLVIDPKGIAGGLGYDIAVFLNNLYWGQKDYVDRELVIANLSRAIDEFSTAFAISQIDLRKWAFATQVLGSWWTFDEMRALYDNDVAKADIWDV